MSGKKRREFMMVGGEEFGGHARSLVIEYHPDEDDDISDYVTADGVSVEGIFRYLDVEIKIVFSPDQGGKLDAKLSSLMKGEDLPVQISWRGVRWSGEACVHSYARKLGGDDGGDELVLTLAGFEGRQLIVTGKRGSPDGELH